MDIQASSTRSEAVSAIRGAAEATGANFDYLLQTAMKESSLNPEAKARTSSATGLFQFIEDTWLRVVDRYGAQHGLQAEAQAIRFHDGRPQVDDPQQRADILALRNDPDLSARLAGELANENGTRIRRAIGREATPGELYAAHFFGPSQALKFIRAVDANPDQLAADLFPRAARSNHGLFYRQGDAQTVGDLMARFDRRLIDAGPEQPLSNAPPRAPGGAFDGLRISLEDKLAEAASAATTPDPTPTPAVTSVTQSAGSAAETTRLFRAPDFLSRLPAMTPLGGALVGVNVFNALLDLQADMDAPAPARDRLRGPQGE